jgi:hypothetical protein
MKLAASAALAPTRGALSIWNTRGRALDLLLADPASDLRVW